MLGEKERKLGLFFQVLLGLKGEVISSFIIWGGPYGMISS